MRLFRAIGFFLAGFGAVAVLALVVNVAFGG